MKSILRPKLSIHENQAMTMRSHDFCTLPYKSPNLMSTLWIPGPLPLDFTASLLHTSSRSPELPYTPFREDPRHRPYLGVSSTPQPHIVKREPARGSAPHCYIPISKSYCTCLLYTSPSPRDRQKSRMPSSA